MEELITEKGYQHIRNQINYIKGYIYLSSFGDPQALF